MGLKELNNAWLSPTGRVVADHPKFFERRSWHVNLAECILADIWNMEDTLDAFERAQDNNNNCTEELEQMGWIRLHGFGGRTPVWIVPCSRKITKKQEATILDWCIENGRNFDNCFSA